MYITKKKSLSKIIVKLKILVLYRNRKQKKKIIETKIK